MPCRLCRNGKVPKFGPAHDAGLCAKCHRIQNGPIGKNVLHAISEEKKQQKLDGRIFST